MCSYFRSKISADTLSTVRQLRQCQGTSCNEYPCSFYTRVSHTHLTEKHLKNAAYVRIHKNGLRPSHSTVPPSNFALTKSPVLKPAPGRIFLNTLPLAIPTSSVDGPSQPRKHMKIFSSYHHSSCRAAMKRSLNKIAGLGGRLS